MTASHDGIPPIQPGKGDIAIATSQQLRQLSVAIVSQTRRLLDISSRTLESVVYEDAEFIDASKKLALSSRGRIRLLVLDPDTLIAQGNHRLLELALRVSSHVEIRRPGPNHRDFNEALLIADRSAFIQRKLADRYDGVANLHAPLRAAELAERFELLWQHGEAIPHFRRLML